MKINIDSVPEYQLAKSKGYEPLIDKLFVIDISVRIEVQKELFGEFSPKNHDKFYRWCWKHLQPGEKRFCEETGSRLQYYSSIHISHILSKGSNPAMMYDPRNVNIVTANVHHIWENGYEEDKKNLCIWEKNQKRIELLKTEYFILLKLKNQYI